MKTEKKYSEESIKLFAGDIMDVIENCIAIQESEVNGYLKERAKINAFDDIARLAEKLQGWGDV